MQGALLLLLFRVSHLLEDRLTEKAAGSLERLFDSVPDTASLVEVDEGGAPRAATTQQVRVKETKYHLSRVSPGCQIGIKYDTGSCMTLRRGSPGWQLYSSWEWETLVKGFTRVLIISRTLRASVAELSKGRLGWQVHSRCVCFYWFCQGADLFH